MGSIRLDFCSCGTNLLQLHEACIARNMITNTRGDQRITILYAYRTHAWVCGIREEKKKRFDMLPYHHVDFII